MTQTSHSLVPTQKILTAEEKQEILAKHSLNPTDLPKIKITDAAIATLDPKQGDIVEVTRDSKSAKEAKYYRVVING